MYRSHVMLVLLRSIFNCLLPTISFCEKNCSIVVVKQNDLIKFPYILQCNLWYSLSDSSSAHKFTFYTQFFLVWGCRSKSASTTIGSYKKNLFYATSRIFDIKIICYFLRILYIICYFLVQSKYTNPSSFTRRSEGKATGKIFLNSTISSIMSHAIGPIAVIRHSDQRCFEINC